MENWNNGILGEERYRAGILDLWNTGRLGIMDLWLKYCLISGKKVGHVWAIWSIVAPVLFLTWRGGESLLSLNPTFKHSIIPIFQTRELFPTTSVGLPSGFR